MARVFAADRVDRRDRTLVSDVQKKQVKGIEPSYLAWKASVLPLNYTCMSFRPMKFYNNGYFTMVCAVCQVLFERDFWARGPTADPPP